MCVYDDLRKAEIQLSDVLFVELPLIKASHDVPALSHSGRLDSLLCV